VPAVLAEIGLPVAVKPPGPVQEYVTPELGSAVIVAGACDAQIVTGATEGVGFGFTVKRPEAVPTHWVVLLVMVTVYVPFVVTEIGFPVAVKPLGPVHE
jgi:hypothetical protein